MKIRILKPGLILLADRIDRKNTDITLNLSHLLKVEGEQGWKE